MHSLVDQYNLLAKMEKRSGGDDDQFRPYTSSDTQFTDDNTDEDDEVAVNSDGHRGLLVVRQAGW